MNVIQTAKKVLTDCVKAKHQWYYDNPDKHDFPLFGSKVNHEDGETWTVYDVPTRVLNDQLKNISKLNAVVKHRKFLNQDDVVKIEDNGKSWILHTCDQRWTLKNGRFGWYLEKK